MAMKYKMQISPYIYLLLTVTWSINFQYTTSKTVRSPNLKVLWGKSPDAHSAIPDDLVWNIINGLKGVEEVGKYIPGTVGHGSSHQSGIWKNPKSALLIPTGAFSNPRKYPRVPIGSEPRIRKHSDHVKIELGSASAIGGANKWQRDNNKKSDYSNKKGWKANKKWPPPSSGGGWNQWSSSQATPGGGWNQWISSQDTPGWNPWTAPPNTPGGGWNAWTSPETTAGGGWNAWTSPPTTPGGGWNAWTSPTTTPGGGWNAWTSPPTTPGGGWNAWTSPPPTPGGGWNAWTSPPPNPGGGWNAWTSPTPPNYDPPKGWNSGGGGEGQKSWKWQPKKQWPQTTGAPTQGPIWSSNSAQPVWPRPPWGKDTSSGSGKSWKKKHWSVPTTTAEQWPKWSPDWQTPNPPPQPSTWVPKVPKWKYGKKKGWTLNTMPATPPTQQPWTWTTANSQGGPWNGGGTYDKKSYKGGGGGSQSWADDKNKGAGWKYKKGTNPTPVSSSTQGPWINVWTTPGWSDPWAQNNEPPANPWDSWQTPPTNPPQKQDKSWKQQGHKWKGDSNQQWKREHATKSNGKISEGGDERKQTSSTVKYVTRWIDPDLIP